MDYQEANRIATALERIAEMMAHPLRAVQSTETVTADRDAYLAAIRGTFRVLESRGQAPDDNAPLEVTVRRVLDYLDKVTAERDALAAQLAALKKRVADAPRMTVFEICGELYHSRPEPRNWETNLKPIKHGDIIAWVRLEDGEK